MLRFIFAVSAICVLMLFGYGTMEKNGSTFKKGEIKIDKSVGSDMKNTDDESTTNSPVDKTKKMVKSIIDEAASNLQQAVSPELKEDFGPVEDDRVKDLLPDREIIPDPIFKAPIVKQAEEQSYDNDKQWEVMEDTQRVLADVGEMLK